MLSSPTPIPPEPTGPSIAQTTASGAWVTCRARVTGVVIYKTRSGLQKAVPLGPCLIEPCAEQRINIIWGASAQYSAELAIADLLSAEAQGYVVLLD
jgi:hypothetical protein